MRINLNLREVEYLIFKKRFPILKDKDGGYYFESSNPYVTNGFGLSIGLPRELEEFVIYDDEDSE